MKKEEALKYIKDYFKTLFVYKELDKITNFLHPDYWDDDIGDSNVNHISSSKEYLSELFKRRPHVGVKVIDANIQNNVITAYLEWHNDISRMDSIWMKGVAIFVLESSKIIKRHTYIYYENE